MRGRKPTFNVVAQTVSLQGLYYTLVREERTHPNKLGHPDVHCWKTKCPMLVCNARRHKLTVYATIFNFEISVLPTEW